jgi:hypothetical protein
VITLPSRALKRQNASGVWDQINEIIFRLHARNRLLHAKISTATESAKLAQRSRLIWFVLRSRLRRSSRRARASLRTTIAGSSSRYTSGSFNLGGRQPETLVRQHRLLPPRIGSLSLDWKLFLVILRHGDGE